MRQPVDLDRQRGQGNVEHRPGLGGLLLPGGELIQYREIPNGNRPVGAENRATASDQHLRRQPTSQSRLIGRPAGSLAMLFDSRT
jgi:hypothetical protein